MFYIKTIKNDWLNGLHNEIPKCCILWYIIRRRIGIVYVLENSGIARQLWNKTQEKYTRKLQNDYIHCAICAVRGRSIKLHACCEEGCL